MLGPPGEEYLPERGDPEESDHNHGVDRTISATVDASPQATMAALADLGTYPAWLSLVAKAEPAAQAASDPDASDPDASGTWLVTLRARLGPLARSKRLRMVRTELDERSVRFVRRETDDREHADWVLSAELEPRSDGRSDVRVHLHYSGALWSAPLELVLRSFEGSAADRLSGYLADRS